MPTPLRIIGMHGSPYSRKLLSVLRYRRIPYAWTGKGSLEDVDFPQPRVQLLPQLILEDDAGQMVAVTDSTPIIRDLDRRYPKRKVRPTDPVVALVDSILEDWADEWLTKAMFHYRWSYDADIDRASQILPRWSRPDRDEEEVRTGGKMFAQRQIGRLAVVGSNETTKPIIEESYTRTLLLLSNHLASHRFLMGKRPGASDFAVYGQLTQLTGLDPTPAGIALSIAPRVVAWVNFMDDMSGLEPSETDWLKRKKLPPTLRALLQEVGRVYAPFLLANARAIAEGADVVECTIDGKAWVQSPFPYQAKCLGWLREEHAALAPADRADADALLKGTGCEAFFARG
jgi:glutathione S-transferase